MNTINAIKNILAEDTAWEDFLVEDIPGSRWAVYFNDEQDMAAFVRTEPEPCVQIRRRLTSLKVPPVSTPNTHPRLLIAVGKVMLAYNLVNIHSVRVREYRDKLVEFCVQEGSSHNEAVRIVDDFLPHDDYAAFL